MADQSDDLLYALEEALKAGRSVIAKADAVLQELEAEDDGEERTFTEEDRARIDLLPDAELVWLTLVFQDVVAQGLTGRRKWWERYQRSLLGELMLRFVPDETGARAMAMYHGDEEPRTIDYSSLEDGSNA